MKRVYLIMMALLVIAVTIPRIKINICDTEYIASVEAVLISENVDTDYEYTCLGSRIASCMRTLLIANELRRYNNLDIIKVPEYRGSNTFIANCLRYTSRTASQDKYNEEVEALYKILYALEDLKFVHDSCVIVGTVFLGSFVLACCIVLFTNMLSKKGLRRTASP